MALIEMTLYAGPLDGKTIEIMEENLKFFPIVGVDGDDGGVYEYALDNDGKFVFIPDPNDPKVQRGWFVCDDDGNVISEEKSVEGALDKLGELEKLKDEKLGEEGEGD